MKARACSSDLGSGGERNGAVPPDQPCPHVLEFGLSARGFKGFLQNLHDKYRERVAAALFLGTDPATRAHAPVEFEVAPRAFPW